jgi:flagellar M-ring protein FliF
MASPFEEIVVPEIETSFMDNADLISIVQIAVAGIAFIAILLVVVRPAIATIMKPQGGTSGNNGGNGFSADQIQALSQGEAPSRPAGRSQLSEQLLDTANTYDEKVALVRLLVSEDSGRVANVLKSMIKTA